MVKMTEAKVTFYPEDSKPVSIKCEVAKNLSEKMKGLMYRDFLPPDRGMLFSFSFPWIRFFWMKNMKIPLDIIFVDRNLRIITIYKAPIYSSFFYRVYWSRGFCKYVIETNKGFCKKYNIIKHTKVEIKNMLIIT